MVEKAAMSAAAQPSYVCRMISPDSGHSAPPQAVCRGALLLVCILSVCAHAFMISMAFLAWASSRVTYQASAWVYAATASLRSSEQPLFGFEKDPHSTLA